VLQGIPVGASVACSPSMLGFVARDTARFVARARPLRKNGARALHAQALRRDA